MTVRAAAARQPRRGAGSEADRPVAHPVRGGALSDRRASRSPQPDARSSGESRFARHGLGLIAIIGLLLVCPWALAATSGCEARAARTQESIPAERLANWEPVDDHTLLVWTLHDSRAHLVELDHPVPGLLEAPIVYLVTPNREPVVCACGRDGVRVPGGGSARIVSIRYLSESRTAELDPQGTGASRMRATFT